MATITLYRDEECTDIIGSGIIGTWVDIYGGVPSVHVYAYNVAIGDKQVTFNSLRGFSASRVKQDTPTEIIIPYTETDVFQKFYFTPDCGFTLKVYKNGANSAIISNGVFFANIDGQERYFGEVGNSFVTTLSGGVACKIVFRAGEKAHYNNYGSDVSISNTNYLGFDLISYDNQGRESQNRGYMIIAPSTEFIIDSDAKPYKPETGNRSKRSGTGTGYYPNNPIPALPTSALNAAFSAVLGRGSGLTYYRFDGDCLEKLTEFLYDTTLTLKFRNSEYRDAVASIVYIPYNVTANVVNTKRIIYLANKGIYPNSACDVITEPFREIDFGYVDLTAANIGYKTFADYTQTSSTLYLPAYGAVNIDMSAFAGGLLHLRAMLDVRNGNILYRLESQGSEDELPTLYGQYTGNCGIPIPLGGANSSPTILGAITSIGTVATGIATANPVTAIAGMASAMTELIPFQAAPSIDVSGAMQPAAAGMGTPAPVLQIRKKIMLNPPKFAELRGKMSAGNDSDTQYKLSDFTGYFQAAAVDVSGINGATDAEKAEIESLLKGGVYL